jgi:hypothetical protein
MEITLSELMKQADVRFINGVTAINALMVSLYSGNLQLTNEHSTASSFGWAQEPDKLRYYLNGVKDIKNRSAILDQVILVDPEYKIFNPQADMLVGICDGEKRITTDMLLFASLIVKCGQVLHILNGETKANLVDKRKNVARLLEGLISMVRFHKDGKTHWRVKYKHASMENAMAELLSRAIAYASDENPAAKPSFTAEDIAAIDKSIGDGYGHVLAWIDKNVGEYDEHEYGTPAEYALEALEAIEDIALPIFAPTAVEEYGRTAYKRCVAMLVAVAQNYEAAVKWRDNKYNNAR